MKDFLTDRNGVVCHGCFATIDITGRKMKDPPKAIQILQKYLGEPEVFLMTCSTCNRRSRYSHSEIKPIVDWIKKEDEYQNTIAELKSKLDETTDDATKMARKIIIEAKPAKQEDPKLLSESDKPQTNLYQ